VRGGGGQKESNCCHAWAGTAGVGGKKDGTKKKPLNTPFFLILYTQPPWYTPNEILLQFGLFGNSFCTCHK
jgi:hypothetical protein